MSVIQINEQYRINHLDDLNYAIQEKKVAGQDEKSLAKLKDKSKVGEVRWTNVSYHRDLAQACTRLAKTLTDETVCESLEAYADTLKRHCDALAASVHVAS